MNEHDPGIWKISELKSKFFAKSMFSPLETTHTPKTFVIKNNVHLDLRLFDEWKFDQNSYSASLPYPKPTNWGRRFRKDNQGSFY